MTFDLSRIRAVSILKNSFRIWSENSLDLISAGVAFWALFSIFPAMAASVAIFGLFADPVVIRGQLDLLADVIPRDVYDIFRTQIEALLGAGRSTLGWATALSVAFALWSARAGVGALVRGVNQIYGGAKRGGVQHMIVVLGLTFGLVAVALAALVLVVAVPIALAFVPLAGEMVKGIELARWSAALFILLGGLALIYKFGPNGKPTVGIKWLTPGATLAVGLWFVASWGFSSYLSSFGNYNEVYGSLGAFIALLMWFYISSYLVLLGAVLNCAVEQQISESDN